MEAGETVSSASLQHALLQVRSIEAVHDLLSEDMRGGTIEARRLLDTLSPVLTSGRAANGKAVDIATESDDKRLPSRIASAVALSLNELVANSIRHGGHGRDNVKVVIELHGEPGQIRLTVSDDGPGFPQEFSARTQNIGLALVRMLIERDLGGIFSIETPERGATVTAVIPFG